MRFWKKNKTKERADIERGLGKTREKISGLFSQFSRHTVLDDAVWQQVRRALLLSDMGLSVAQNVLASLQDECKKQKIETIEGMWQVLSDRLHHALSPFHTPWVVSRQEKPQLILMIGINGGGKTTSSGKLAAWIKASGHSVLLAAADTFRAAAIEQLQSWGEKVGVDVIAQAHGADPAAVIFDAYQAAMARGVDYVIADTAGRLHTQDHLLKELSKIHKVMARHHPDLSYETWLVLDGSLGQSSLEQAKLFQAHCRITGLVMTKLDGSAKGGVILPACQQLKVPVRFIGLGEGIMDLKPFDVADFVQALCPDEFGS